MILWLTVGAISLATTLSLIFATLTFALRDYSRIKLTDQFDKAEKRFHDVRDADPNFVAAVNALGELSLRRGEDEK